ncbi:RNA polymerase sigma factor [Demequina sp. SO4-13]|uniref:RNA polymerase sigma factor n=1 Tax=Demequina sp. SO4-13 TaxID=3401027 RepID=UPI003AF8B9EB
MPAFLDSDYAKVVGAVALATGDRERAEDAVQDALVKTLSGDTEPENLSGWVTVVAINFVRQAWRRTAAQGRAYVRAVVWDDTADDESERAVDAIAVREALDRLPERQRLAVTLHYFEGLTVDQVASALDVSSGTIKTQLSRGRAALARSLRREAA